MGWVKCRGIASERARGDCPLGAPRPGRCHPHRRQDAARACVQLGRACGPEGAGEACIAKARDFDATCDLLTSSTRCGTPSSSGGSRTARSLMMSVWEWGGRGCEKQNESEQRHIKKLTSHTRAVLSRLFLHKHALSIAPSHGHPFRRHRAPPRPAVRGGPLAPLRARHAQARRRRAAGGEGGNWCYRAGGCDQLVCG